MAQDTTRDKLWKYALNATHTQGGSITAARLEEVSQASIRSARDVLETMAEYNVLVSERDGNGRVYYPNRGYFVDGETRQLREFEREEEAAQ